MKDKLKELFPNISKVLAIVADWKSWKTIEVIALMIYVFLSVVFAVSFILRA